MNQQFQKQETRLGLGQYTMAVVNIRENVKCFQGRNGQTYRHDIYFEDMDAVLYRGEYLTLSPAQRDFTVGETCCFEVVNANMNEIIKCKDASLLIAKPTEPAEELHGVRVSGTSHAIALGFAKDLAVARIRMGMVLEGEYGAGEDLIHTILTDAWKLNEWLLDPKEPLPF